VPGLLLLPVIDHWSVFDHSFVLLVLCGQVFRSSTITVDMDLVRQIEAKYPAFLFKQQLTAFVEGLYAMIRDNVKKELSSLLLHAIQVCCHAIFGRLISYTNQTTSEKIWYRAFMMHMFVY
jgi:hypothetical protein